MFLQKKLNTPQKKEHIYFHIFVSITALNMIQLRFETCNLFDYDIYDFVYLYINIIKDHYCNIIVQYNAVIRFTYDK